MVPRTAIRRPARLLLLGGLAIVLTGAACARDVNTNIVITNTPDTGTTLSTNTTANTNTSNSQPIKQVAEQVSFSKILTNPALYDDRYLCVQGYYQHSFEFNALSATRDEQTLALKSPYVWLDVNNEQYVQLDTVCRDNNEGTSECFSRGQASLCGYLHYSAEPKFGHVGAYQYLLDLKPRSAN